MPATATLTIVDPSAPTANDTFLAAGKDATTTLTVSGSDQLYRDLTFAVLGTPTHGTLSAFHDTTCTSGFCEAKIDYTTSGYVGSDSYTFTVAAGGSTSTPATVQLDVNEPPCPGKIITNGTVKLGVNCKGELNVDGIGLQYVPDRQRSTSPGCACEGWGAGDTTSTVSGWANQSSGNSTNLTQVSFVLPQLPRVSVVDIGTTFRVTHDDHPSPFYAERLRGERLGQEHQRHCHRTCATGGSWTGTSSRPRSANSSRSSRAAPPDLIFTPPTTASSCSADPLVRSLNRSPCSWAKPSTAVPQITAHYSTSISAN